jgi:beta-mannosidase
MTEGLTLAPNQTTEIMSIPCPHPSRSASEATGQDTRVTSSHSVIISARVVDTQTGQVLSRYVDWPQPYRLLEFPDPGLSVDVQGERLTVTVQRPVKGLVLSADGDGPEVRWSNNGLDVMPGDPQEVVACGLGGRRLKACYMGAERPVLLS